MNYPKVNDLSVLLKMLVFLHMQVANKCASLNGMFIGCDCPNLVELVCGSNMVTYKNMCTLYCAAANDATIGFAGRGPCLEVQHPCKCYPDDKPVCGSDGRDYKNKCDLACQRLIKKQPRLHAVYLGKCTDDRETQWQNAMLFAHSTFSAKKSIIVTSPPGATRVPVSNVPTNAPTTNGLANTTSTANVENTTTQVTETPNENTTTDSTLETTTVGNNANNSENDTEKMFNIFHEEIAPSFPAPLQGPEFNIFHEEIAPPEAPDQAPEFNIFHEEIAPSQDSNFNIFHEEIAPSESPLTTPNIFHEYKEP